MCFITWPNMLQLPALLQLTSVQQQQEEEEEDQEVSAEEYEIKQIIAVARGFLSALSTKSRAGFNKHCIRAGGMSLSPPSSPLLSPSSAAGTGIRFCTLGTFVEHISSLRDNITERFWDPQVKIDDARDFAAVWAPFRAQVNGVVDHVGVELFVLHRIDGHWKVTGLADSCRFPSDEER